MPSTPLPSPSDELVRIATDIGLSSIESATSLDPAGSPGVAGWWRYMYVGIWVARDPITPDGDLLGTIDLGGLSATRYSTEDGPMAAFACQDRHLVVGILGVDDNVTQDPLVPYARAVAAAAC